MSVTFTILDDTYSANNADGRQNRVDGEGDVGQLDHEDGWPELR